MKSKLHEIHLRELKPGTVEYQVPSDAIFPYCMVFNKEGSSTTWGRTPKAGRLERKCVGGFLKKSWGHCQLTWSVDGEAFHSQKIHIGWGKLTGEDLDWSYVAAKYRVKLDYLRERIHVHENLQKKAVLHLRPAGREAHGEAIMKFVDIQRIVKTALSNKEKLIGEWLEQKIEEAKEKENWANGQDGVYPEPPEQKWYEHNGELYLKAKDQHGFDRRPHELWIGRTGCRFYPFGGITSAVIGYCLEGSWNEVARGAGAWQPMSGLNLEKLNRENAGKMLYVKYAGIDGDETCSFFVPKLEPAKKVELDYKTKAKQALIKKIRGWKKSPPWAGWYHRYRWNRVLLLLGETEDIQEPGRPTTTPMQMSEIEELAKMPWGYRWKEVRDFLKS